jgi:hypothetical protein
VTLPPARVKIQICSTSNLPLIVEAARQVVDADDDESRFRFGVDALLRGFAQGLAPSGAYPGA